MLTILRFLIPLFSLGSAIFSWFERRRIESLAKKEQILEARQKQEKRISEATSAGDSALDELSTGVSDHTHFRD
jgi:hypothetical protein